MATVDDLYDLINHVIEDAFFEQKYNLNFFDYLTKQKYTKKDLTIFMSSFVAISLSDQIKELDLYINETESFSCFEESYAWMGKDRAKKLRDFLNTILEDAKRYEKSKRRGRKPKTTTNK